MRRRFDRARRRQPVATWGFLRPYHRVVEQGSDSLEKLRQNPRRLREYRSSLAVQLGVTGVLALSCLALLVQSITMLHSFERVLGTKNMGWLIPVVIGALGLAAFRRFLRVLAEYRQVKDG